MARMLRQRSPVLKDTEWREFPADPRYFVCSDGNIKRNGLIISPSLHKGYKSVTVRINRKFRGMAVHRMIATVFIPNPESLPAINHKNGIKTDNRVENLEWITIGNNVLHARRVLGVNAGENSQRATMDNITALAVFTCFANKKTTYSKIASDLGLTYSIVNHMARGNSWRNLAKLIDFKPFNKLIKGRRKVYVKNVGKVYLDDLHA